MSTKKITGIILCVIGLACLGMSYYIKEQVAGGQEKIESAQRSVDQSKKLFSQNPVSKEVGNLFMGSAQKEINKGAAEIVYYAQLAQTLQIGGIVLIIAGVIIVFFPKRSSK